MRLRLPRQIDKKQWLNRLGVKGEVDTQLLQQLDRAERKLLEAASPQGIYRVCDLESSMIKGEESVTSSVLELPGNAIKKHLAECNGMVVMAVTLGTAVDRLIRTSQIRDMAEAVLLDSGASILAEQCADVLEESIHAENSGFTTDGCEAELTYYTGRYSPGYGDFPIEMQRQLINAVDGPRTIGLTVNESSILIPRKSITAIIGTADHPVTGYLATCDECAIRENCRLLKEGTPCWK
jgi:hypothetical protein